jgi:hypothetical protein
MSISDLWSITFHTLFDRVDNKCFLEADLGQWRMRSVLECGNACMSEDDCSVFNVRLEYASICRLIRRRVECAGANELSQFSSSIIYESTVCIYTCNVQFFSNNAVLLGPRVPRNSDG